MTPYRHIHHRNRCLHQLQKMKRRRTTTREDKNIRTATTMNHDGDEDSKVKLSMKLNETYDSIAHQCHLSNHQRHCKPESFVCIHLFVYICIHLRDRLRKIWKKCQFCMALHGFWQRNWSVYTSARICTIMFTNSACDLCNNGQQVIGRIRNKQLNNEVVHFNSKCL